MEIRSARELEKLREVLQNSQSKGPPIAYWVFNDITQDKWENMTVTVPGRYDKEYPKTYDSILTPQILFFAKMT